MYGKEYLEKGCSELAGSSGLKTIEETEWAISSDGFDPLTERGVEAVLSVANGHYGVRASLEEGHDASNSMVIVAGVYVPTGLPAGETLLTLADPATFQISINQNEINLDSVETLEHVRWLDLRTARSMRRWIFVDPDGRRWRWESMRAASATEEDCYLYELRLTLEEGPEAEVMISLPNEIILLAESRDLKTELIEAGDAQDPHLLKETAVITAGRVDMADGSISALVRADEPFHLRSASHVLGAGDLDRKEECKFDELLEEHQEAWQERWQIADVEVDGNTILQQALRFSAYQMLSAAAVNDGRTSIGPRDLSGRAYHGHVFWDTEIFVLPFLTFVWPEASRSCLLYRHRTLRAAQNRASTFGFNGAMYAWESTDTGDDHTPDHADLHDGTIIRVLNGEQEIHISADVPYAVLQYWRATGDDDFMRRYGAEILLECARFWCSRVSPGGDAYSIRRVIGPDEYHESVDNNAYTNAMARRVLEEASSYAEQLQRSDSSDDRMLLRRLGISDQEVKEWAESAVKIGRSQFYGDEVVEQFDGFFELEPIDVASYRTAGVPIDVAIGHEAVQRARTVKQGDVLMALCLLPELWTEASARRSFEYYEPITAHTSSLSPPVHAIAAAWLRDESLCRMYLQETIGIDLADSFRRAAGGIHLGALGGLWQAVVFGMAGLKLSSEGLALDPFLLPELRSLSFSVKYRGGLVRIKIASEGIVEILAEDRPCGVRVNREVRVVGPGQREVFRYDPGMTFWSATGRMEKGND